MNQEPVCCGAGFPMLGIFAAAGQTCIAGSRVFAHKAVYDELLERVAKRPRSLAPPRC